MGRSAFDTVTINVGSREKVCSETIQGVRCSFKVFGVFKKSSGGNIFLDLKNIFGFEKYFRF